MSANVSRKPTLKQKKFVDEYLKNGGNGLQAAKTAGYSGDSVGLAVTASQNLRKPYIKQSLERKLGKILNADQVLTELSIVARDRKARINGSDKIKALELIGKHLKLFTDKIEVQHSTDQQAMVTDLADRFGLDPSRAMIIVAAVFGDQDESSSQPIIDITPALEP
jgi:phage terminase small subunit